MIQIKQEMAPFFTKNVFIDFVVRLYPPQITVYLTVITFSHALFRTLKM